MNFSNRPKIFQGPGWHFQWIRSYDHVDQNLTKLNMWDHLCQSNRDAQQDSYIFLEAFGVWCRQIATAQDHDDEGDQASNNSEEESSNDNCPGVQSILGIAVIIIEPTVALGTEDSGLPENKISERRTNSRFSERTCTLSTVKLTVLPV